MSFVYVDDYGDTLEPKNLRPIESIAMRVTADGNLGSVVVPYTQVRALVEALLEMSGEESYVIPKSDPDVDAYRGWLRCGEGKSYAEAPETSDPADLLAKAASLVTIAREIQSKRDLAAAEQALESRRNKITKELAGDTTVVYAYASDLAKNAIDLVIKMQDEKEEKKND